MKGAAWLLPFGGPWIGGQRVWFSGRRNVGLLEERRANERVSE